MDTLSVVQELQAIAEDFIGHKGARLKHINAAGYRVPLTYCIPHTVQDLIAHENGVRDIRDFTKVSVIPKSLSQDIERILQRHPSSTFVVRSSCTTEDLPFASAAGQYSSYLNLRTPGQIVSAIVAVMRTVGDQEVIEYLRGRGLNPNIQRMALLLQEMERPDISGVLYTVAPRHRSEMLAEYDHGVGTAIVSGSTAPKKLRIPRDDQVPDSLLASDLRNVGLALEQKFGSPQDIEWGMDSKGLVLFQSRDIVEARTLSSRSFSSVQVSGNEIEPMAGGLAIGWIRGLGSTDTANASAMRIAHVKRGQQKAARTSIIAGVDGLICETGGELSHLASVCREFGVPAIIIPHEMGDNELHSQIVLDGDAPGFIRLDALDPVRRKEVVFDWARNQFARGRAGASELKTLEGVVVNQEFVRGAWNILRREGLRVVEYVEDVQPFDFVPQIYCGISVRIQKSEHRLRLQFKRAVSSGMYRQDHEIHFSLTDVAEGNRLVSDLGYVAKASQQRLVARVSMADITFQFNYWPKATGVYLGIEAQDNKSMSGALQNIGDPLSAVAALDGTDLFRLFNISLEHCNFLNTVPSFNDILTISR